MNNNVNTNNDANIMLFQNELFGDTRFIKEGDSFSVVAKDVVEKVGNTWNGAGAVAHVPAQWKVVRSVLTSFGTKDMICLSEQGLYFYLGRCDKPAALQYQMWIAGEVVPQIRKTGGYIPVKKDDTDLEVMCRAFEIQRKTIEALEVEQTLNAPKVATYDAFLSEGDDEIPMGTLANRLCQEGLPFGLHRLFAYLRQQGVLCEKGSRKNLPTQRYVAKGWFKVIAPPPYAGENWKPTLRVTPKGVTEITSRIHELLDVGESIGA